MKMKLEAIDIGYRYKKKEWVLKDVSVSISQGEIVGMVAPSGYGKTTLASILAGYLTPTEGTVLLGGNPLPPKGYNPVQMVFQHPEKTLNPRWKMADSLNEGWNVTEETKSKLGIQEKWLDRWPNELSGGEQQRFCIARALAPETKFLIADEISTMLDAVTQAEIWTILKEEAKRRNLGILVISHDQHLIDEICDRVIYLDKVNKEAEKI